MSIIIMHDAIAANASHLPSGQTAGYDTGTPDIKWPASLWQQHPQGVHIDQDVNASDFTSDVLDVERGAATVNEAANWYARALQNFETHVRSGQRMPAIYTSASNITALVNALIASGVKSGPQLWVANWNLNDAISTREVVNASGPFPIIAVQFDNGQFYDTSVVSTTWLNRTSHAA